jgi:hypothetical protein
MASEASKLNDQNVKARSTYGSSRKSLFRAIGPGGFGPGRASLAEQRGDCLARLGRQPAFKYRISHFSGRIY